jgi:biotin carboxyl carrier protein
MRYYAKFDTQAEPELFEIKPLESGGFIIRQGDQEHRIDALTLEHGAVSLLVDNESYSVEIDEVGDEVLVSVRGQMSKIDVVDERKLALRQVAVGFSTDGAQTVSAPMPGKVVKLLVKVGDAVEAGQGLIVVEAMKMENELKSPKAGKVIELFAAEGATVENNAKLVVVE